MFYRESNVACVCYDQTRRETIDSWIANIREESPDCVIFLVATKGDLMTVDETAEAIEFGETKKEEVKAKVFTVTSGVTRQGVESLFLEAAKIAQDGYQTNENVVILGGTKKTKQCC
jgi:GTPase SAR1 family protein